MNKTLSMRTQPFCTILFVLAAVFLLVWRPTAAQAQVSLTLSPFTALPGDLSVSVFGSLTNSGPAAVDLSDASFNLLSGPAGADLTSAVTFSGYSAPLTLTAGQVYSGALFTVDTDAGAPLGTYSGNLAVSYGDQAVGQDVTFNLETSTPVPEASTLPLLGLGMVVILGMLYRRRRVQAAS